MRIPGREGGVPIGRTEVVSLDKLRPEGQIPEIPKKPPTLQVPVPWSPHGKVPFAKPTELSTYAKEVVANRDVQGVTLVGSTAAGKVGKDTDIVYDFGKVKLPTIKLMLKRKWNSLSSPPRSTRRSTILSSRPMTDISTFPAVPAGRSSRTPNMHKTRLAKPTVLLAGAELTQLGAPATVQEEGEHGVQTTDRGRLEPDTGDAEPRGLSETPPAGEQPGAVQGATEERPARGTREGGGEAGEISGGEPGGAGAESAGGVGVRVEPGNVSEGGTRKPATRGVKPSSSVDGNFYHITPDDHLGEGGLKTKFRQNVAAVKLLKKLQAENDRLATPDEQAVLVKYVGWGGLQAPFKYYPDKEWEKEAKELKDLLTPEEFEAASGSTQFAHYTSPEVIQEMWSALERIGFSGGRVLEPAAGVGHFIGGAPLEIAANSRFAAVEIDPLSAGIARQLYQPVKVFNAPFQKVPFPRGFFDLAITNVPFSDTKPADPQYDKYGLNLPQLFHRAQPRPTTSWWSAGGNHHANDDGFDEVRAPIAK